MAAAGEGKIKVLLFGLGAIGGFYAFILGRNENVELSVVARSNYDAVKKDGLKIESENHGNHVVNIKHVYRTPSEASPTKFDYVVCAHKAINPSSTPPLFKEVADSNTTFVIMQNGVGNEEPFRQQFPNCTIISGVVWVGGVQKTPGIITHTKNEDTKMGLYPNTSLDPGVEKQRLDGFAAFFEKGGTKFELKENVQIDKWEKCVWNAAWNPLTALTQCDTTTWLQSSPEAMAQTRQLMREMILVAQKCDVPLKLELADELIDKVLNVVGAVYSSMYVDMRERRGMEVEVILGTAVRKAREFGVEVPVLGMVYALVNAADARIRTGKGEHP